VHHLTEHTTSTEGRPAMATTSTDKPAKGNTAVAHEGDHDRVQMLSLQADGTPDQHNPEIIGDPEAAKAAAREQFKQQAVSAVDVQPTAGGSTVDDAPQDPSIAEAQAEHDKVAKAAEKAADAAVDALTKG
jgi:hypothetical protein